MSNRSNNIGRAYEFAWINTLFNVLSQNRNVVIINNSSYLANKHAWESIDIDLQNTFNISASAAVNTLLELEPRMTERDAQPLILELQTDKAGTKGDVRDILIKRENIQWEIGLSIKHNHNAIKHSRLSPTIDFGNEWFGTPCSAQYWDKVNPVFNELKQKQLNGLLWNQLPNKARDIYIPLLTAFMEEITNVYNRDNSIPRKMIEYLIGIHDYHKIISYDNKKITIIKTFNIHNTLNKPSGVRTSIIKVPSVILPTELVAIKFKQNSNNTVEMYLNNGWQLSFRIHNAEKEIKPSLKFDIQFIGTPPTILTIECKWQ